MKEILLKLIAFLYFLSSITLNAQEGRWVQTEGDCFITNITYEEAVSKAITKAEIKALEEVAGVYVTGLTTRILSETMTASGVSDFEDHFSKFNLLMNAGKILKKEIIQITTEVENNLPKVIVKLNTFVVPEEGKPDPTFRAEIVLDKSYYFDNNPRLGQGGEEIKFKLKATQDCYLYLFNLMSYDSVQLIFPNKYIKDNRYVLGKEEQKFERQMRAINMKFYAEIPPDKNEVWEGFFLVALKEKIDFTSNNFSSDGNNIIPTYRAAFEDMMHWLIKVPIDKRTEDLKKIKIILKNR